MELRALNRSNRTECQAIVDEGGRRLKAEYFVTRYWNATLYPTVEQVFGDSSTTFPVDNVMEPILLLHPEDIPSS